jgi:hypothetical protein
MLMMYLKPWDLIEIKNLLIWNNLQTGLLNWMYLLIRLELILLQKLYLMEEILFLWKN